MGVPYIIGGFLIISEPVQGSPAITLFPVAALLVGGIVRIVVTARHRELAGWWLFVLAGPASISPA